MNAQSCLEILREIKDVAFATVNDEGRPEVRIIDVMLVENGRLYFCTGRGKDFYRQLMQKPEVAVTGLNKEFQMVRLSGKAVKLADQKYWIDRIFRENPAMEGVYPGESCSILEPFCIKSGTLEFFDLGQSPIYRASFTFGEENHAKEKGFRISDACIGCGRCMRNCPQQCITQGTPFSIHQENCLHCGLCFEGCPVHAIMRK
jgi:uncharacterized pyridoxamine 5'-phosphate oxidase family protein/NAD-dependent dihydropyrimidine dehydrogenase PreA subunit